MNEDVRSSPSGPASLADRGGPSEVAGIERRMHRHVGVKVLAVVAAFAFLFVLQGVARNKALQWNVVGSYLFSRAVLTGLARTLLITVLAIVIAVVLGVILANMRLSSNRVLQSINAIYVWFFRSIPLLVLLIIAYNFSLLYSRLSVGLPFGPSFVSFSTKDVASGLTSAVIAFGLQQAAYTSEVIRSAIMSVPSGQVEAAYALAMTRFRTMRMIVLPQAARIAVPPIANETINLCKSTSLVAFISVPDLLYSVQEVYARTFQVLPLLIVATLWYIVIVSLMSIAQWRLEKRFGDSRRRRVRVVPADLP
jgi:polar amino acid transport system permease protein